MVVAFTMNTKTFTINTTYHRLASKITWDSSQAVLWVLYPTIYCNM